MIQDQMWEQCDISDYHRLSFLGDNINDVLSVVLKNITIGVALYEIKDKVRALYLNDAYFSCAGFDKEQYASHECDILSTVYEEDIDAFQACITEHVLKHEDIQFTFRGYKGDGSLGWFQVHGVPLENKVNESSIYLTILTDITDKKELESNMSALKDVNAKLLLQEERYKILEATAQGLLFEYCPDTDTMIFSYNFPNNKKRKELANYSEYIKTSPLVHSSHLEKFKNALFGACKKETEGNLEYLSSVSGGGYRWHSTYYKSLADADGKILSVIGRIRDIHESKMEQEKLNYKADMDGLTGLYRREAAFEKMQEYVNETPDGEFYFVILDLDDFKQINDQFGHQYGDEVLKKTADELTNLFGETSILGRFGGDEFVILTRNIPYKDVEQQLVKLKEKINFCAGIVAWKENEDIKSIFDKADKAMYHVKLSNKNGICFLE